MISTVVFVMFRILATVGYLIFWERFNPLPHEEYFWRVLCLSIFVLPQILLSRPIYLLF